MSDCCHHSQSTHHAPVLPAGVNPAETVYLCPMHLDVRQLGPGACPKCGMALEPEIADIEAGEPHELIDFRRRLMLAALFTLPLFVLEMSAHWFGRHLINPRIDQWLQWILATPVVCWSGLPFFERAVASLRHRAPNMFTLVALGTGSAYLAGVAALLVPAWFPAALRVHGVVPVYFEAAAVIVTLVLLGQVMELKARQKTGRALQALLGLAPTHARRIEPDGTEKDVARVDLRVGDAIRVRPGEKIPVDATVTRGDSYVDEAGVTGEPMPAAKSVGDTVFAGTLNGKGGLVVHADKVGHDTLLAHIVQLVATAQRSQPPLQRLADRVSAWFVPAVALTALLTLAAWLWWAPALGLQYGLIAAVSVLIIACPCALGLAAPMSTMVGIGRGARLGVLVKNAAALEKLAQVDTLVLDKTGTLTEGKPSLVAHQIQPGFSKDEILRLAAALESGSEHPLAEAFMQAAGKATDTLPMLQSFEAVAGRGVRGSVAGQSLTLGNAAFAKEQGIALDAVAAFTETHQSKGASVVTMTVAGRLAAAFAIRDQIKQGAKEAVATLQHAGIRLMMATGDQNRPARAVAEELGIAQVHAGLLPTDKGTLVKRLMDEGAVVAMAGDGINDAPALAAAHVGIAMGGGTDIAVESAAVTLLKGDIQRLVQAVLLARATRRNIRQNLFFAFAYNAAGIPLAAGALYPLTGALLAPEWAALAMSLSSVSVIANALRLNNARLGGKTPTPPSA